MDQKSRNSKEEEEEEEEEETVCYSLLELALGECARSFKLENAVCNHGFFMMAPNIWIPSTKTLKRPLRLADSTTSVMVSISQPSNRRDSLSIRVHGTQHISSLDQEAILSQVARMLRISSKDEMTMREFQNVHPEARKRGFGRLFRSPTLFEDAVKSILLCHCSWTRSLKMADALCELQRKLSSDGEFCCPLAPTGKDLNTSSNRKKGLKRKHIIATDDKSSEEAEEFEIVPDDQKKAPQFLLGNFPSSQELASLKEDMLERKCNLGFRARHILNFAKNVESGRLGWINRFEELRVDKLYHKLMAVKGFGPFVCANFLMCLGFYHKVPIDTETKRHLREVHAWGKRDKRSAQVIVEQIYGKYNPFQCLAYWLELLDGYERVFGKLSELPKSSYTSVSGVAMALK